MNLLLDENLSPRLLPRLSSLFPGLIHVRDIGLKRASDDTIWEWAKTNGYTIVTADADSAVMSGGRGWPPKVVHLQECDYPLRVIEDLLRRNALRISEFDEDVGAGLLPLRLAPDRRFR